MAQPLTPPFVPATVADLLAHVGDIPADRVRLQPTPGAATEQSVLDIHAKEKRLCELIDGVLVEKTVGTYEAYLATLLVQFLGSFVRSNDLGIVLGADGMLRIAPGQVRIPDVAFISWDQLPERTFPRDTIASFYPDLAVEVLSRGNTEREMARKLDDYFSAGTRLIWYLDPDQRMMRVYTSPTQSMVVGENDVLDGGEVLPGFSLPLQQLFAEASRQDQGSS